MSKFSFSVVEFLKDIIQYTICVLNYFIIPVAKHLNAFFLKISRTVLIIFDLSGCIMLPTIQLDSQLLLWAIEVKYKILDRMLATEFVSTQAPVTQVLPEVAFDFSLVMPQNLCEDLDVALYQE